MFYREALQIQAKLFVFLVDWIRTWNKYEGILSPCSIPTVNSFPLSPQIINLHKFQVNQSPISTLFFLPNFFHFLLFSLPVYIPQWPCFFFFLFFFFFFCGNCMELMFWLISCYIWWGFWLFVELLCIAFQKIKWNQSSFIIFFFYVGMGLKGTEWKSFQVVILVRLI